MIIKKHSQEIALYERRLALLEHVDESFREGTDLTQETYDTSSKRIYDAYKDVHSPDGGIPPGQAAWIEPSGHG